MFYRVALVVLVIVFLIVWRQKTAKSIRELEKEKDSAANDLNETINKIAAAMGLESSRADNNLSRNNELYIKIINELKDLPGDRFPSERQRLIKSREAYNKAAYTLNDQIVTFPYSLISKSVHASPAGYVGTDDEIREQISSLEPQY